MGIVPAFDELKDGRLCLGRGAKARAIEQLTLLIAGILRKGKIQMNKLSRRELEVIHLLLQGKSNKMIALALGISERTIEFHLKNVYAKYQVSSRMELVLKLGNTTGEAISENLGHSTVAQSRENMENGDRHQSETNWAASLKIAMYLIGKELTMKKNIQKFHIANAILWAAAIIATALLGSPTTVTIALLPSLAACSVFFAEYLLNRAE